MKAGILLHLTSEWPIISSCTCLKEFKNCAPYLNCKNWANNPLSFVFLCPSLYRRLKPNMYLCYRISCPASIVWHYVTLAEICYITLMYMPFALFFSTLNLKQLTSPNEINVNILSNMNVIIRPQGRNIRDRFTGAIFRPSEQIDLLLNRLGFNVTCNMITLKMLTGIDTKGYRLTYTHYTDIWQQSKAQCLYNKWNKSSFVFFYLQQPITRTYSIQ